MALPRLLVAAVLAAWVAPAIAWAQPGGSFRQPPSMLRQGTEPPKGTAILRGVVVAADSGAPVRRAQVRASASDTGDTRTTLTDEHGRFELRELVGGHYSLGASKGGFISLQYGQRRPGEPGTPVDLAAGQTLEKLTIALPRGSVITGRIVDEYGEPLTGAQVQALRNGWVSGARRLQAVGAGDRTDDQGTYRIFGLPPGEYLVTATLRDDRPMLRGGQADDLPDSGYAPTYFPGTSSLNDAQKVNVGLGEEVSGVGFGLSLTRLASISGRVLAAPGYESGVQVVAVPADGARLPQALRGTQTRNDGTFDLRGVPPGRYRLQAMSWGASAGEGGLTGATTITVNGTNLEGLTVALAPAPVISGLVQRDANQGAAFRASQVRITAVPVTPSAIPMGRGGRGGGNGRANDDFTFQVAGLSEPAYLRVTAPGGWYVKGVFADGRDITETPLSLEPGSRLEGVRVVLTQTASSLSGAVRDAKGSTVLDAAVVIFPDDEARWTPQSRFIATARPDTTGTFTLSGLPASERYRVIAVQGLESGQANDPEFLASVRDQAERLTLGEGEAKTIELRLKP